MNLTTEQIKAILDGAPDGATHYQTGYDIYYILDDKTRAWINGEWKSYFAFVNTHKLSDIREILTLRQEVERLEKERDAVMVELFNHGYRYGHHDTVEGVYTDIHRSDMTTYHEDVVTEILEDLLPQPPKDKKHG